jgi:hypothetical protein
MPKKTAKEKLHCKKDLPNIKPAPDIWGGGSMVIAHPEEIDAVMRSVPEGKLITIDELRAFLAVKHKVDICCPMTAGMFSNIAAAAAQEDLDSGETEITPFWRTLKKNGELNPKYPGGLSAHKVLLETEGHIVIQKRKRMFVSNFKDRLHIL